MVVYYRCRQCNKEIGKVSSREAAEYDLGFQMLTQQEQSEMIITDDQGHLHVDLLCDDCHQLSDENPDLHEQQKWFH